MFVPKNHHIIDDTEMQIERLNSAKEHMSAHIGSCATVLTISHNLQGDLIQALTRCKLMMLSPGCKNQSPAQNLFLQYLAKRRKSPLR